MQVVVYKNLIRGDWSVAALKGSRGRGQVIAHRRDVALRDCRFVVQQGAQRAVAAGGHRSVHAWIVGTLVEAVPADLARTAITYNPRRSGRFTRRDNGAPVAAARYVAFTATEGAQAVL
jgi:hypothetical protein